MTVNASAVAPEAPSATRRASGVKPTVTDRLPTWVHPEVVYWYPEWKLIRDAIGGEKDVKAQTTTHLPALEDMSTGEYAAYLDRATYYNFSGRTVSALVGTLFKREPSLEGASAELIDAMSDFTRDSQSFKVFRKEVASELASMNRVGILCDLPAASSGSPRPYATIYTAENILWWEATEIDGRDKTSKIVLRESHLLADGKYYARYRELSLQLLPDPIVANRLRWTYVVRLYTNPKGDAEYRPDFVKADGVLTPYIETIPENRGVRLDTIPFEILSTEGSSLSVKKPTMLDICRLNISHFRSYADLEHGRFFTGFPIYYIELGPQAESGDYRLGPSRVWESPIGSKPGVLEFNGNGLKFLENALKQKESQASSLGGRMIGVETGSTSESDNQTKMKDRNEQAILLDLSLSLDEGLTKVVRIWARFRDVSVEEAKKILLTLSKDFLFETVGAREYRAIQAMYKDGLLPVEVFYEYMKKEYVIPDWMSLEEFTALLDNPKSFPGQPDADARARGYPNRQSEIDDENADLDRESKEGIESDILESTEKLADKAAKTAAKIAKQKPAAPGAVPGKSPVAAKKPAAKKPANGGV